MVLGIEEALIRILVGGGKRDYIRFRLRLRRRIPHNDDNTRLTLKLYIQEGAKQIP